MGRSLNEFPNMAGGDGRSHVLPWSEWPGMAAARGGTHPVTEGMPWPG